MSAIITSKFRVKNAENMIASLGDDSGVQSYYTFIGRTEEWPNDAIPPAPTPIQSEEHDARHNMLAMKRVTSPYVSHMAPRYNFIVGQTYDAYDDTVDLTQKQYYVVTDALNVYKCIKAGPSWATIEPTHTNTDIPDPQADGYQWKYLYTIDGNQVNKFMTGSFIPVPTAYVTAPEDALTNLRWQVENAAIDGAIHAIVITNGGTGYNVAKPTITVSGDGVSCEISSDDIDVDNTTGALTSIRVSSLQSTLLCGEGYTQAKVTISGGSGQGATARAVISPQGGHGKNLVEELNAYYVCVDTKFIGAELDNTGDFLVDNKYRQIGIIKNPIDATTQEICANTTYNALTILELTSTPAFAVNTTLECVVSGAKGWIDSIDAANNLVKINQNITTGFIPFAPGDSVRTVVNNVTTTATIATDGVTAPEIITNSGEIVYIENITPVQRQSGQTEDVKLILEL